MRAKKIFEKFIEDSDPIKDMGIGNNIIEERYINQDDIINAGEVYINLREGEYILKKDTIAWVVDRKDQIEGNQWIGRANVPRVKLSKIKLSKGTKVSKSYYSHTVYLENSEKPVWLVDPTRFANPRRLNRTDYEELRSSWDKLVKKIN